MKYIRRISEAIDAVQWNGDNKQEMFEFLNWFFWSKIDDVARGPKFYYSGNDGLQVGQINVEIGVNVEIGDYIVKDGDEFIVYTEDIFNETFELAFQNSTTGKILLNENNTSNT
jgi:hypothetical protein